MQHIFGSGSVGSPQGMAALETVTERLFFAIFPPPPTAAALVALGQGLRRRLGLHGLVAPAEKLHVTLAFVGGFSPLPVDLVAAAKVAGDRIVAAPFAVTFSTAGSFAGRAGPIPYVLHGGEQAALRALNAQLVQALLATRSISGDGAFEPHLTLLRDRRLVANEAIAVPTWQAQEFALVRSSGEGSYRVLQRWPLTAS